MKLILGLIVLISSSLALANSVTACRSNDGRSIKISHTKWGDRFEVSPKPASDTGHEGEEIQYELLQFKRLENLSAKKYKAEAVLEVFYLHHIFVGDMAIEQYENEKFPVTLICSEI